MDQIQAFVKAEQDYDEQADVRPQIAPGPNSSVSPTHVSRIFMSHFGFLGILSPIIFVVIFCFCLSSFDTC